MRIELVILHQTPQPTYQDLDAKLLIQYAKKDITLMRRYITKQLPIIRERNQEQILELENKILAPFFKQERIGLKIDVNYVKTSVHKLRKYIRESRQKLYTILGSKINVNQHLKLKEAINQRFNIDLKKSDLNTFKNLMTQRVDISLKYLAKIIINLRSLEK